MSLDFRSDSFAYGSYVSSICTIGVYCVGFLYVGYENWRTAWCVRVERSSPQWSSPANVRKFSVPQPPLVSRVYKYVSRPPRELGRPLVLILIRLL